ncbi:hypothetical protein [Noviherbaspirillum humi]|nr:hypothetical protein [Noviherbaspirillum humi]
MSLLKPVKVASCVCLFSAILPASANDAWDHWRKSAGERYDTIMENGSLDLYVSGRIRHGRGTYSDEKIQSFNERDAWGLGIGRTWRNPQQNDESLYAFVIRDSHYKPQLMAGYAYLWTKPLAFGIEGGLGWTAQLMSRQDYFGGFPFPVVLPLAAIGPRGGKLFLSYVPRLSSSKGNGDVLFAFGRITLD